MSRRPSLDAPWGAAENLGEPINSPYDEVSPMLAIDGHRMYFASNRPGGLGGNDIYVSRRHNKRDDFGWKVPRNLGEGVNTPANEAGRVRVRGRNDGTDHALFRFEQARRAGTVHGRRGPQWERHLHERPSGRRDVRAGCARRGTFDGLGQSQACRPPRRPGVDPHVRPTGRLGVIDLWVSTRESTRNPWSRRPTWDRPSTVRVISRARLLVRRSHAVLQRGEGLPTGFGRYDLFVTTRSRIPEGEWPER